MCRVLKTFKYCCLIPFVALQTSGVSGYFEKFAVAFLSVLRFFFFIDDSCQVVGVAPYIFFFYLVDQMYRCNNNIFFVVKVSSKNMPFLTKSFDIHCILLTLLHISSCLLYPLAQFYHSSLNTKKKSFGTKHNRSL